MNKRFVLALGSFLALLWAASGVYAAKANPGVIPPHAKPYGMTYGEWSAKWYQWQYSLPVDQHPLFDTADCSEGQTGKVWFLGGTFSFIEKMASLKGRRNGIALCRLARRCSFLSLTQSAMR
jgi:hypothetical protein